MLAVKIVFVKLTQLVPLRLYSQLCCVNEKLLILLLLKLLLSNIMLIKSGRMQCWGRFDGDIERRQCPRNLLIQTNNLLI